MSVALDQIGGEEQSLADLTPFVRRLSDHPFAQGGFGDIWKCELVNPSASYAFRKPTSQDVAVKAIRSHALNDDDRAKKEKRLSRELRIWKKLVHKNILPLHGIVRGFGLFAGMVCSWAKNGSLNIYLESYPELPVACRFNLLSDIASGLHYLHSNQVVHGDLTGSNVLVMENGTACLSDFGLSGILSEFIGTSNFSSTVTGNIRWGAPELFAIPDNQEGAFTIVPSKKADIYSFGSVMLQVLSGKVPYYYIKQPIQIVLKVVNGKTPKRPEHPQIADNHWDMIQSCWNSPNARPSSDDIFTFITTQCNR